MRRILNMSTALRLVSCLPSRKVPVAHLRLDIPEALPDLLRRCIPNIDAAELLLHLARHPDRAFRAGELAAELKPAEVTPAAARNYAAALVRCGLAVQNKGSYRFAPRNPRLSELVQALGELYTERPVTLVRMIYTLKEDGLHAFAGTFTLKKP
jgi:hypothetical protein